jgi:hypothetical protein
MFGSKRRPFAGRDWLVAVVVALAGVCLPPAVLCGRRAALVVGEGLCRVGAAWLPCAEGSGSSWAGGAGAVRRRASGRMAAVVAALVFAVVVVMVAGVGSALGAPRCAPSGANTVCTFSTSGEDTFTVPGGVSEAGFDVFGAQGGFDLGSGYDENVGGWGGQASAQLGLTPGAVLTVVVGGRGGPACGSTPGVGGVNGGAPGGRGSCPGAGGGGASDVRMGGSGLSDRVLVAGGGGGTASVDHQLGGDGGGLAGTAGVGAGDYGQGSGGDQTGSSGSHHVGAGSAGVDGGRDVGGGGGGGGYYGGAGGPPEGAGGGGSGFGPTGVVFHTGVQNRDGQVVVTYATPAARCLGRSATVVAPAGGGLTRGTPGKDVIVGSRGPDMIASGGGPDRVCSRGGGDVVGTGAGADRVSAGPGDDRVATGRGADSVNPGSGRDRVSTGPGNDQVGLAGKARDRVDCGAGIDHAQRDRADRLRRCEAVRRR